MSAQDEMWRVSTIEGVFEADLDTLKQWIVEGCVLPTDKVSKGSLNWIEAGRAPMLRGAFNGEVGSTTVAVATTDASAQVSPASVVVSEPVPVDYPEHAPDADSFESEDAFAPDLYAEGVEASACNNHPDTPARYICRVCAATFCDACPKFIGVSSVPLCPLCGDLCRPLAQERERFEREEFRSTPLGFGDFGRAIRYPWQHKIPLLFGALLYGFCLLAGIPGLIGASVLLFGCIAHVINQVAYGKFEKSFMPDFTEFSLWDDLVVRVFLGIGITIVTWGPSIVIAVVFAFSVINGAKELQTQPSGRLTPAEIEALNDPHTDPEKLAAIDKKLDQREHMTSSDRDSSPFRPVAERPAMGEAQKQFIARILGMGLVLLPFFLLSVLWGIFYYPMALTVAGYTEQFRAVINPLVGLDTIKRMGGTYFRAIGMVLLIQIVGGFVMVITQIIFLPFNLPMIGNLPAKFVHGGVTFYLNLVIACILGLALHKCADRLAINVD